MDDSVPRARGGWLTAINGRRADTPIRIFASAVVGRSVECDIRIDDLSVSRRHARIVREDENGYVLRDLGSRNGTTVRGLPITRHHLKDGDEIGIGPAIFRFGLADRLGASTAPGEQSPNARSPAPPGAIDRDRFDERLVEELARAKRTEADIWLLLLGIDPVGGAAEDQTGARESALRHVATTVEGALRSEDVLAYCGDTQFAILAKERRARDPLRFAERIRRLVQKTRFVHDTEAVPLTVSVGVAALADCRDPSADQLLRLADAGFYAARISGRNCCRRFAD